MQSRRTKDIVKQLAYDFNMSEKDMYNIVKTPFDLLVEVMRSGDRETVTFPSVRLISFGTFFMSKGRRDYFINLNKKSDGEINSGADRSDNQG